MLEIIQSSQFKRDIKKAKKQNQDLDRLKSVIVLLAENQTLDDKYQDHLLTGNYKNFRECHIKPNWLLIYKIDNNELLLARLGSHSELFN